MARIFLRENIGIMTPFTKGVELATLKESRLTEAELDAMHEKDAMYLLGPVQVADEVNGNNRIYQKRVLEMALNSLWETARMHGEAQICGELGHPDTLDVNIAAIVIKILETWWEKNRLMGKIEVLSNHLGDDIKRMVHDNHLYPGISSRALGSVHSDGMGRQIVEEDLQLITWDLVATPSAPGAFLQPALPVQSRMHENQVTRYKYPMVNSSVVEQVSQIMQEVRRGRR